MMHNVLLIKSNLPLLRFIERELLEYKHTGILLCQPYGLLNSVCSLRCTSFP